ncbi:TetR/AcrR family transcriptional regulator [Bogoriella caseilytica]|uniref:TetR family transcriptional regulator n=1 Tax=Bogoriella caseilytica TaxID=56055 RepID=A0A3N2BD27_9MICO|nr:TetR/AcrR family transcriptional regulator [Bogoriella caseilytica]ROR72964.1 TetR family transcriptional regulator [Bogoriella caseilytica]
MPRASAAAAAATAREVLAAARDLFASRGFAQVSLDDVAQSAGVTRGAVYHHFGSKQGLFRAVVAQLQAEVAAAVLAAAECAGDDPVAQLRAGSHAFLEATTHPSVARILLIDAPAVIGWQEWRELDAQHSGAHLREILVQAGEAQVSAEPLAVQLSGAMNEAALWLAQRPGDSAASQSAHGVLDRLLAAVHAPGE